MVLRHLLEYNVKPEKKRKNAKPSSRSSATRSKRASHREYNGVDNSSARLKLLPAANRSIVTETMNNQTKTVRLSLNSYPTNNLPLTTSISSSTPNPGPVGGM